jgi:hypothetical protein
MLSKGKYLGLIIGGFVGAIACFGFGFAGFIAAAITGDQRGNQDAATAIAGGSALVFLCGFICMITAAITTVVLWYKAWAAIQDGHARTTPGTAVGFLFIPLFNLYWGFQAIHGFAVDYNKFIARHNRPVTPLPEGLYLAVPIMTLICMIPFVSFLISPALMVVHIMLVIKTIDAVNALGIAPRAMGAPA